MAFEEGLLVEWLQALDREVELVDRLRALVLRQELGDARVVGPVDGKRQRVLAERRQAAAPDVLGAGERASAADGPGQRRGVERQRLLDLVERSNGSRVSRSILLMKVTIGMSRRRQTSNSLRVRASMPLAASIPYGRVDGGEGPVGVLGKVLVARRIEKVEDAIAVLESHHRGHDGNAALALDAHPVGAGLAAVGLGAHFAGELNGPPNRSSFRSASSCRRRVRNDREGASARDGVRVGIVFGL